MPKTILDVAVNWASLALTATLAVWGPLGCDKGACATTCACLDDGRSECRETCEEALAAAKEAGCGAEADALSSCITDTDYSCEDNGGFRSLGSCEIPTVDGCVTPDDIERDRGGNSCDDEADAFDECTVASG